MEPLLLQIKNLKAHCAEAEVLRGIDLDLNQGEILFVLGPNGAGKSTLLRCLAGRVSGQGQVLFGGENLLQMSTRDRVRRGVVLCPEGRRLFPEMTVKENLLLGAHLRSDSAAVQDDLHRITQYVPWLPDRLLQAAGTLSGGEQQIVAVARALMARPRILLLDEPTVGLAPAAMGELREWLSLQSRERGVTILGTEQNVVFAKAIADRLAILGGGWIRSILEPHELVPKDSGAPDLASRFFGSDLSPRPQTT